VQEWEELLAKLSSINLGLEEDLVTWKLEKNGHYQVTIQMAEL